jgi:dipeptidyl aminopeptidase/acylaminoacyl peptidase
MQSSATLIALSLAFAPGALRAQTTSAPFKFTIANIMRGPEVYGREPSNVRWSADGQWIYFQWLQPGSDWREGDKPFRVRAQPGATPEQLTQAQMDSAALSLDDGVESRDGSHRLVTVDGDLYLVDAAGNSRRLTQTVASESNPAFSVDGRQVFFVAESNVYALDLETGLTRQLTDIHAAGGAGGRGGAFGASRGGVGARGGAARDTLDGGQRGALEREQRELFDAVRDRIAEDSIRRAEREAASHPLVQPITLRPGERVAGFSVSPNGKALLLTTVTPTQSARSNPVPNYITESGYVEDIPGRSKVGDFQSTGRIAFVNLVTDSVHFLNVAPTGTAAPFARVLGWNDDGSQALIFATSTDFKNRWIQSVSAATGALHLMDALHDSAWVAGPCFGCGGWYANGSRAWFVSEADGYAHLYSMAADGSDKRQLTRGKFEVSDVVLSKDGKTFYLTTTEASPFEQNFYRMSVDGGTRTRITTRPGGHTVTLSPNEHMLADVYSEANRPPELFIERNEPGAQMSKLTTSPTAAWLAFDWIKPQIVMVPASDGVQVPARIFRPSDVGAKPNGAAVIFVHGAGYLHEVVNYWSPYPREYMFNQYLASKGYVVLDMDYRGSAGYGRDWRTAIYRWMGGRDLQDEVDGSRYLQKHFGVNPERIGMYGGSYGGFMTLMALFTAPKSFGAGAALRPVVNWANYNHGYTGRILNMPDVDTLAYRRSSPIYFAQNLEDPLIIMQGMVDTNVHFEGSVELAQRLIELGKTDWWLQPFPVENHGFVRPDSWTDEYTRIFNLFESTIRNGKQGMNPVTGATGLGH